MLSCCFIVSLNFGSYTYSIIAVLKLQLCYGQSCNHTCFLTAPLLHLFCILYAAIGEIVG